MKQLFSLGLLFLITSNLFCQHPNYDKYVYKYIDHKFDNYQTPEISNAIFLLNGDSIEYAWDKNNRGLGYAIPKENIYHKNKFEITHPDYKSLILDSACFREHYYLYLFQEGEEAYIENGMPVALNYGKKYIAIKVSKKNYSPEEAKLFVEELCKKKKLKIGVSYQDSIKKLNELFGEVASEKSYGGLGPELKYIFWLEKEDKSMFANESKVYRKIRKKESIEWLSVPQDFYSYVLNDFEIEFKLGTDSLQINSLIEKYNLEILTVYKTRRVPQHIIFTFKNPQLLPNNELMRNLMGESIIKYVRPKKIIYDTNC